MVSVEEGDRDVLLFLWLNDIFEDEVMIRPLQFTQVVFGVCSSPGHLTNSPTYHTNFNYLQYLLFPCSPSLSKGQPKITTL